MALMSDTATTRLTYDISREAVLICAQSFASIFCKLCLLKVPQFFAV